MAVNKSHSVPISFPINLGLKNYVQFSALRNSHRDYVSSEFGHVAVIVLEEMSVDRDVGPAVYHAGERPVGPGGGFLVPVIDFPTVGQLGDVNRRCVHFGGQYGGERAVLTDVRTVIRRNHRRHPTVDHDPKREFAKVSDPRLQYVRYSFK